MTFRTYAVYSDSNVEWVGRVPDHWNVCALSYRYEVALGKMLDEKRITRNFLAPYLRNIDVQWGRINVVDLPEMDFEGGDLIRYALRPGDLLVCEGGDVGRAAIWTGQLEPCFYQKALHRLRCQNPAMDDARFLFYGLRAAADRASGGKSTISHLTAEALRRHHFPFPSRLEQTEIVTFLDRETGKIDALVSEQERLIALLREKRQAVISQAVTKGLDPNAPMNPSGVEWLGDVPAHWQVVPVKALFRFVKRQNQDVLLVLSVYRDFGVILKDSRSDNINKTPEDLSSYQTVHLGDLVINKMKSWQGSLGISALTGITSPDYAVFAPVRPLNSEYLNWLLRCNLLPDVYRSISNGIRPDQWRLEPDRLRDLRVPYPPKHEQVEIAKTLREIADQHDELADEAQHAIELLKERRAALISAAVTGKIDVRNLVRSPAEQAAAA